MCRHFALSAAIWLLIPVGLLGQVTKITDERVFSPQAVFFNFIEQKEGAEVSDLFSQWGMTFVAINRSAVKLEIRKQLPPLIPEPFPDDVPVLLNRAPGPLVVNVRFPVKRVGFFLAGNKNTQVSLRVFDDAGNLLGVVSHAGLSGGQDPPTLVGIETTAAQGIARIIISFLDPAGGDEPEELDAIRLDFVSRPTFKTFLAQIGDGTVPDTGIRLQTVVSISNPNRLEAVGSLKLFDDSGRPLSLVVSGTSGASFDFSIPHSSSKTFTTAGTTRPVTGGYARIEANAPIEATAVFQTVDANGNLIAEAGVKSDSGKISAVGTIHRALNLEIDSGVALVNTSAVKTALTIQPFDESGIPPLSRKELQLEPGQHIATFFGDLFPTLAGKDFRGSLVIRSAQPLAVVVLRTRKGLGVSSLPVASTEK